MARRPRKKRSPSSIAEHRRLRILVVEDQESYRDVLVEALRLSGDHEISLATTAAEGLHHLRDDDYDLIVSDVGLGGASGLDMLDKARREGLLAEAAIIVSSADESLKLQVLAQEVCWMPKPIDLEKLSAVVSVVRARVATVEERPLDESGVELTPQETRGDASAHQGAPEDDEAMPSSSANRR